MSNNLSPTDRAKRKQIFLAFAILVGVCAVSAIGIYLTEASTPATSSTKKSDIKSKSFIAPGEKVDPEDAWRGVSDKRLNLMENQLAALDKENKELKQRLEDDKKKSSSPNAPAYPNGPAPESMSDDELDNRLKAYEKISKPGNTPTDTYPDGIKANPRSPGQATPVNQLRPVQPGSQPGQTNTANGQAPLPQGNGFLTVKLGKPAVLPIGPGSVTPAARNTAEAAPSSNNDSKDQQKTTKNYLPTGMFGQAVILSGLDAPTGGQAQSNPHPVLLQLRDLSILPNRYRYDWKECFVTGAGYGDISSERAYIRTESLSCVSKNGNVLDVPLKGYIAGEDGKAGMRGRLVSKQGQALANALLAGVVSGIGSGIEKASSTTSVSPLGSTTTTSGADAFKSGVGTGVGKAMDRLANYYIQLAEKMFPVIEIDAGRMVDVVLTKGVFIDVEPESK